MRFSSQSMLEGGLDMCLPSLLTSYAMSGLVLVLMWRRAPILDWSSGLSKIRQVSS